MSQNTIYGNQVQWRALSTNLDCQRRPLFHTLPKEGSQLASVCELWSKLAPTLFGGSFLSFSCSSGKSEMSLYSHYREIFLTGFIQVYVDMLFLIPHTNSSNSSFMIVALVFTKMLLINDSDATNAWHCYMSFDDSNHRPYYVWGTRGVMGQSLALQQFWRSLLQDHLGAKEGQHLQHTQVKMLHQADKIVSCRSFRKVEKHNRKPVNNVLA